MIDCHKYCGLRVEVIREVDNLEGKLKAQYRKVTKGYYNRSRCIQQSNRAVLVWLLWALRMMAKLENAFNM